MDPLLLTIVFVVVLVIVVFFIISTVGRLLRKVGPNQALIVYGAGGTKVVTGGSRLVIPLTHRADVFSLELMSFDVAPSQDLNTIQGVEVLRGRDVEGHQFQREVIGAMRERNDQPRALAGPLHHPGGRGPA